MSQIDWSAGRWTNPPVSAEVIAGDLHVAAVEGSDAWRHTSYGFVHENEHALLAPFRPGSAVEVEFTAALSAQFDQAGVFIRASLERWIKAGVEFVDGVPQLGAVVTDHRSDWSSGPVPGWAGRRVVVRASWADDAITIRAGLRGESLQLVRVAPFDAAEAVAAGPYVCAPTRSGLVVPFHSWRATEPDAALH